MIHQRQPQIATAPNTNYRLPALHATVSLLGGLVTKFFVYVGEISELFGRVALLTARGGIDIRDLVDQMSIIGYRSVPIAVLTTFASGAVIALYFATFLVSYGAGALTGAVVALAIGRELAPVLVGVVVAARAGSAIAAEIGTMRVTEQIDALRSLAISPIQYLVVPRVLASLVVLPILCVIGDFSGLTGGYIVAVVHGVPGPTFSASIHQRVEFRDFGLGAVKTIVFGLIISLVGCHQGLSTRGGATGVGRATTNAVVLALVLIYISNYLLADAMFGGDVAS